MHICNTKKPKLVKTTYCLSFLRFCKNSAKNKFKEESLKSAKINAIKGTFNAIDTFF